jgi:hypothetical protein
MRLASAAAFGAALLVLTTAGYQFVYGPQPSPSGPDDVLVPNTDFRLEGVGPGEREVRVTIQNRSAKERRIVGATEACGNNCCVRPKYPGPMTIAPGGTGEFSILVLLSRSGTFEIHVELYLDDDGVRILPVTIAGTVLEPTDVLPTGQK